MNRIRGLLYLLLTLVAVTPLVGSAESETEEGPDVKERFAQLIAEKQQQKGGGNLPELQSPLAPRGVELNEENQALQQQAVSEYFHHVVESNAHQRNVFQWQLLSAKIIFAIVIVLVASGIYFAAVQFHHGIRSGKSAEQETEFEASLKGIKVSSPVLGVIILTISLAFFYLYLVHVYPIEFVGG